MHTIAYKIAISLKKRAPNHHGSVEVLQFAVEALLNTCSTIILALGISLFTGKLAATGLALISFALLRMLSGGFHLKNGWSCTLVSAITANLVSFGHYSFTTITLMTGISIILAAVFAPSRIEEQTRIPVKYFPVLKVLSMVLISSNLFIGSSVIATAFLIQSLLLIKKGGDYNEK
jgi:accessory gene regulator B